MSTNRKDDRPAYFTYENDPSAGSLYYFMPAVRGPGPYKQRRVTAIVDIAEDGSLGGVELIDDMPPLWRAVQ